MPRNSKLSPDDALALVLSGLKGDVPLADLCRRYGVTQTTYYKLRDRFLSAGAEGLQHGGKPTRVKELEDRVRHLERALGRKTLEVEVLKKPKKSSVLAPRAEGPGRRIRASGSTGVGPGGGDGRSPLILLPAA